LLDAVVGGARDGETALVVPRDDSTALAAALDRVLLVPSIASGLAERAREYVVPRFALPTMLDRMENVFQRALIESRRAA